ncbi:HAD-like domain-containing protein [Auriculariales sp. MPI-PUGE-AT-0066]|nr:HAD-like domain-containing protein [Auriculariales sp. MPI-PUGE-AT-0066]
MSSARVVIGFDLYGTLLSTDSISKELAKIFGDDKAEPLATLWRRYQLEYTWRISLMGEYRDFIKITRAALNHAVAESNLPALSSQDEENLINSYDALHAFPEVSRALKTLQDNPTIEAYIFSNGTIKSIGASVENSPDLHQYQDLFKGLVSVDGLGVFKPAKATYDHLVEATGKPDRVFVVSANPLMLSSIWVDRSGKGWVDRLGNVIGGIEPTAVVAGVDEAVQEVIKRAV